MINFSEDKKIILDIYNSSLKEFGETPRGITWGCRGSQDQRFKVLTEIGDLKNMKILDVGCGYGDLFDFISISGIEIEYYLGVDINENLIKIAQKRYPKANFIKDDLLNLKNKIGCFDYSFASGTFGIDIPHWKEFTLLMMQKMFNISRYGIAVNFLTTYSSKRSGSHYVDPSHMLALVCENISKNIVIRQDYKENDFTVYAYH